MSVGAVVVACCLAWRWSKCPPLLRKVGLKPCFAEQFFCLIAIVQKNDHKVKTFLANKPQRGEIILTNIASPCC